MKYYGLGALNLCYETFLDFRFGLMMKLYSLELLRHESNGFFSTAVQIQLQKRVQGRVVQLHSRRNALLNQLRGEG